HRDRERHAGLRMDRRQRFLRQRNRQYHGRMTGRLAAVLAVLTCHMAMAGDIPAMDKRSSYALMGRETRAMQDDDAANPGMLAVLDGEALWQRAEGAAGKSCASCHSDAAQSMQ